MGTDIPIPMTGRHYPNRIVPEPAELVGLVFPVFNFGVPGSVLQYIETFPQKCGTTYFFAIILNQGMPCATLSQLKNALRRQGISLNAGFSVERNAKKDLDGAALVERINQIACLVESRVSIMEKPGTIFEKLLFTGVINHLSRIFIGGEDRKFKLTDRCDGCGICSAVCPAGNIRIQNNRPTWLRRCNQCGACFTWCPRNAIYGSCLAARSRHQEPCISVAEMLIDNRSTIK